MTVIWALFDSGNSCYKKAVEKYFVNNFEVYSIGIDKEFRKENRDKFIHLDLASYSELFGENELFEELDKLPPPTIILASPPCESWSVSTGMEGGNLCWRIETINTLFGTYTTSNEFSLREYESFQKRFGDAKLFKPQWWRAIFNRINGELCSYNTIRIIERYKPRIWVIENPQSSRLWRYYKQIHSFQGIENVAHYHAYDDEFSKKPTIFLSNILLPLKTDHQKQAQVILNSKSTDGRRVVTTYNERSNIPLLLIKDILETCLKELTIDKIGDKGD